MVIILPPYRTSRSYDTAKNIEEIFPRVKEAIEAYLEAVEEETQPIVDDIKFVGVNQIEEIG